MVDEVDLWPDYGKPATKGDVIKALVSVNSCLIDLASLGIAQHQGDSQKERERLADMSGHLRQLGELIDKIGGKRSD